ncbi:unnamed protein product, partial [Discosporangium mesarthrocarpum]
MKELRVVKWHELSNLEHLADGAMCSCFKAELDGETVVIKKPRKKSLETKQEIEREVYIEETLLQELDHPNIIKLLGKGRVNKSPFLVLEYLAGGTLRDMLKERCRNIADGKGLRRLNPLHSRAKPVPLVEDLGWALELAQALHYMHDVAAPEYSYLCRDVKPENVGFTADGTLKLFDFGLAKRVKRSGTNVNCRESYVMTSQTGTVRYMAPEAFLGHHYNNKVDVYAWAHVVAEGLSLVTPYANMTVSTFHCLVALGSLRPKLSRRWPKALRDLLQRSWDVNPDKRPSFAEVI